MNEKGAGASRQRLFIYTQVCHHIFPHHDSGGFQNYSKSQKYKHLRTQHETYDFEF